MIVNKITGFINSSQKAQKALSSVSNKPAEFSALSAFVVATAVRPASILAIPMENKEDKKYSMASSVASGLVELVSAFAVYAPFRKVMTNVADNLSKTTDTVYKDPKVINTFKSVNNRVFKMMIVPFISIARFALVSPLVKSIFKKEDN